MNGEIPPATLLHALAEKIDKMCPPLQPSGRGGSAYLTIKLDWKPQPFQVGSLQFPYTLVTREGFGPITEWSLRDVVQDKLHEINEIFPGAKKDTKRHMVDLVKALKQTPSSAEEDWTISVRTWYLEADGPPGLQKYHKKNVLVITRVLVEKLLAFFPVYLETHEQGIRLKKNTKKAKRRRLVSKLQKNPDLRFTPPAPKRRRTEVVDLVAAAVEDLDPKILSRLKIHIRFLILGTRTSDIRVDCMHAACSVQAKDPVKLCKFLRRKKWIEQYPVSLQMPEVFHLTEKGKRACQS